MLHARSGQHLLARHLGVARGLFHRGPAKDRHELALGRAVLGRQCCPRLAQPAGGVPHAADVTGLHQRVGFRPVLLADPVEDAAPDVLGAGAETLVLGRNSR